MIKTRTFWQSFFVLLLLGVCGLLTILPTIRDTIEPLLTLPDTPDLSPMMLSVVSLINPLILLIIAIMIGNLLASKVGLQSYFVQRITHKQPLWLALKPNILWGVLSGVVLGLIIYLLEWIFQPWLPDRLQLTAESRNFINTLSGVFYGGIVEEIIMRWGLMSLLLWISWRLFQRDKETPALWNTWVAIVLTSLLFAAGHWGTTALMTTLTPIILVRMFVLNGIAGVLFGWLFWKKGLEVAMIAHGTFHITLSLIVWITHLQLYVP